MDVNLHTMMLQNVPSIELNRRLLQNEINSRRVAQILVDASQPDLDLLPNRNLSRTTSYEYNVTASAAVNWPADEYSESAAAVTVTWYGSSGDVTRPAGGNANESVNLNLARKNLARKRLRTTSALSSTNKSANKEYFVPLNRTATAAAGRPPTTAPWNLSFPIVNRTSAEDKWNNSNTTLALGESSTAQSVYCPAIPPGLRELWLFLAFCTIETS